MRRFLVLIVVPSVAVAIGANLLVRLIYTQTSGRTAFTATVTEKSYRYPSGEFVTTQDYVEAARADGSIVRVVEFTGPDGVQTTVKSVTGTASKKKVDVDGLSNSVTTYHLSDDYVAAIQKKPSKCTDLPNDPKPEPTRLLGYEVLRFVDQLHTEPPIKVDRWLAPALDCLPLKEISHMATKGQAFVLVSEMEVTSVVVGEPVAVLFEVPASYKEAPPSAVMSEWARHFPGSAACEGCMRKTSDALDAAYHAQQKK